MREHAGLAGARACDDEQRLAAVLDGLALLGVEPVGEARTGGRGGTSGCRRRLAPAGRVVGVEDQRHVHRLLGAPSDTRPAGDVSPTHPEWSRPVGISDHLG